MYDRLQVTKEVVRGTNAISNVLQFRLVAYIMLGVFHKADMYVYLTGALVHLLGTVLGSMVLYRWVGGLDNADVLPHACLLGWVLGRYGMGAGQHGVVQVHGLGNADVVTHARLLGCAG